MLLLVHHPATEKSEVEAKLKEAMLLILHFFLKSLMGFFVLLWPTFQLINTVSSMSNNVQVTVPLCRKKWSFIGQNAIMKALTINFSVFY